MTYVTDRWKRIPVMYRMATAGSAVAVVIGALIVALIFAVGARSGEARTVECVNGVLGDRSGITIKSAQAQKTFADADKQYNKVLNGLLAHLATDPQEQARNLETFKAASDAKERASTAYSKAMGQIIAVAVAHPLGHC